MDTNKILELSLINGGFYRVGENLDIVKTNNKPISCEVIKILEVENDKYTVVCKEVTGNSTYEICINNAPVILVKTLD
ncbi:MAG: hypothetical protein ACI8WT_002800 [Clostridium sp.]|jgi:hypothetical protein